MKGNKIFPFFSQSLSFITTITTTTVLQHCFTIVSKHKRALFRSFIFKYICVHSFNFLRSPKLKFLFYQRHTSHSSFLFCTVFVGNWSYPSLFSNCCALNTHAFFSVSLFFLSIHSVTSAKTMPCPAVYFVECTMSVNERSLLGLFLFSLSCMHISLGSSISDQIGTNQELVDVILDTHIYINTFTERDHYIFEDHHRQMKI